MTNWPTFTDCYEKNQRLITAAISTIITDDVIVKELASDIWSKIYFDYERLSTKYNANAAMSTILFRVARNYTLTWVRDRKRHEKHVTAMDEADLDLIVPKDEGLDDMDGLGSVYVEAYSLLPIVDQTFLRDYCVGIGNGVSPTQKDSGKAFRLRKKLKRLKQYGEEQKTPVIRKPFSAAHKANIAAANRKRNTSDEQRQKASIGRKAHFDKHPEARKAVADKMKRVWAERKSLAQSVVGNHE